MSKNKLNNKLNYNSYPYDEEGYVIHMLTSTERTFFTNAFIIETKNAIVVVDTMMITSDAILLRQFIDTINKPIIAIIITHGHPDHYNGTEVVSHGFDDITVISTEGVKNCIEETIDAKEVKWKPYFGEDWPKNIITPNQLVNDGEVVNLDGLDYSFRDLGAAESSSDLYFTLGNKQSTVFAGDVVFNKTHAFMNDGNTKLWLSVLERLSFELANVEKLFTGHGLPGETLLLIQAQMNYITFYRENLSNLLNGDRLLNDTKKMFFEKIMVDKYPIHHLRSFIIAGLDGVSQELNSEIR
jgi:glyoxylase-like metal-dependent hydrolase (beta-lactamase superfamily II)